MTKFIERLKQFNRKERYHIIKAACKDAFMLSEEFKAELKTIIKSEIPDDAFVAMDYHFDWIYASLFLAEKDILDAKSAYKRDPKTITANQEDVDLLIAFSDNTIPELTHLIMIEAKFDTAWGNSQLESKAVNRLKVIFGDKSDDLWNGIVKPYFIMMSPDKPKFSNSALDKSNRSEKCLFIGDYPSWMKTSEDENSGIHWLSINRDAELMKVTRCTKDGTKDEKGDHWKVD